MDNFRKALNQLEKGVKQDHYSELEVEGLIQRFEYTFELAWKTLQDYFDYLGYEGVKGPKGVLEKAYEDELIRNGEKWVEMLDDRRLSTHTYNEEQAKSIFDAIREDYYPLLKQLHQTLETIRSGKTGGLFS